MWPKVRQIMVALLILHAQCSLAQSGCTDCVQVKNYQKISDTQGNFLGVLNNGDTFGRSVADIGDLDGDGTNDLVVGAVMDDDGGTSRGAVWIVFLNNDGTVKNYQKISSTQGAFPGPLSNDDRFGVAVAGLGDRDGDGLNDIAVGSYRDKDGGFERGAVWILFLNSNGTVKAQQKISDTQGGFTGILDDRDWFGSAIADLGDVNNDGVNDIAVSAHYDDDGGADHGAVYILFMNTNNTVISQQKISDTQGNFSGVLSNVDNFGGSIAAVGDLNQDGIPDLAVGSWRDDDGGLDRGAVWILFLENNGTVKSYQKISSTEGNFTGVLDDGDMFGMAVAGIGDMNGDGYRDIAVGARLDDDGGSNRGALWLLYLTDSGTVCNYNKISSTTGGFSGNLSNGGGFSTALSVLPDFDGNGTFDIAVGATEDDDGGTNRGAVWILFLEDTCRCNLTANFTFDVVCNGSTTTFFDLSTDSINNITSWQWYFGDGDSASGIQNPLHTYPASGTYSVTLVAGNDASPPCYDTIVMSAIVINTFDVDLGNDTTLCQNDTLVLDVSASASTYSWQDSSAGPTFEVTQTGTYWVTASDSGCNSMDSIMVIILPTPTFNIGNDTTLCPGNTLVLDAYIPGGSYLWQDSSASPTFPVSAAGTYWVTASITGCSDRDTISITFIAPISVNIGNDTSLCLGETLVLDASAYNGAFFWNDGSTNATIAVSQSGTYWVAVTDSGCDNADSVDVTFTSPVLTLGGDTIFCQGDSTQLTVAGASTYQWTPPLGLNSDTSANPLAFPADTILYVVDATDTAGCTASDSIRLYPVALPVVNISGNTALCAGEGTVLNAAGGDAYLWSTGDSGTTVSVNGVLSAWYAVQVWNTGCLKSVSDSIWLAVHEPPLPDAGPDVTVLLGSGILLNGTGGMSYTWNPAAGLSCTGCQYPEASPMETTVYYLSVVDSNGCAGIDSVTVYVDAGGELFVPNLFSPDGDGVNDLFHIDGKGIGEVEIMVFNRWGELVFSSTDASKGWDGYFHGKEVNAGVFVYVVRGVFINGEEFKERGNLTLIR